MTRPRKTTVDYFPHDCKHGKTMFILEQQYGNDGYATWFKILEMLGISEGHFINCNDYSSYAFLIAKTHLNEDRFLEIINLLAEINAIDSELWVKKKIIWSQNFVDNLEDVYSRRKVEKPSISTIGIDLSKENDDEFNKKLWCRGATNRAVKQGLLIKGDCQICGSDVDIEAHHDDYDDPFKVVWFCKFHHVEYHKTHSIGHMSTLNPLSGTDGNIKPKSSDIYPQSKVKESKVKESIGEDKIPLSTAEPIDDNNGFNLEILANLWNQYRPPEIAKVKIPFIRNDKTLKKYKSIIRLHSEQEWWIELFKRIHLSKYMKGFNKGGWRATFDWIMENAEKVYDGHLIDAGVATQGERSYATAQQWVRDREAKRNETI